MKTMALAVVVALAATVGASAQDCGGTESVKKTGIPAGLKLAKQLPGGGYLMEGDPADRINSPRRDNPPKGLENLSQEELVNELEFKANGPRLFNMKDGKAMAAKTGKPLICWMGEHIFADPKAREMSEKLKDTTIQSAMDREPNEADRKYDQYNPRVKFSPENYEDTGKVVFMQVKNFDKDSESKILAAAKGEPVKVKDPFARK